MEPVLDFVGRRIDEVEFCRVCEPRRDQRGRLYCTRPLSQPPRGEAAKLDIVREARGDCSRILRRDRVDQPSAQGHGHSASLRERGVGAALRSTDNEFHIKPLAQTARKDKSLR